MSQPILAYLPPDPLHGNAPIEIRFGDLIERKNSDGSGSVWHAVLGDLYNKKGVPVIIAMLRSSEAKSVTAFPRQLLQYSRRSDADRCSVFVLRSVSAEQSTATAAAKPAPAPPPTPKPAPPTSDFPPGMMSVGMDIDTHTGNISMHGKKRDSDSKDNDSSDF